MISIVQNFICTKSERLQVLEDSVKSLSQTFPDSKFYVNYNTNLNFDEVYAIYKKYVTSGNLNFYNDISESWPHVTLALLNEVTTPYTLALCEDQVVKSSKDKVDRCINEFITGEFDWMLLCKIPQYLEQKYIDGYTPYNSTISPGYTKLKDGYSYLGKHAPHKRVAYDSLQRTDWYKDRVTEFIRNKDNCTHDIPIRDIRKPNFYEGYYDFANGQLQCP